MKARFYKLDETIMDESLSTLKKEPWMKLWLSDGNNWVEIIQNIKPG